MSFAFSRYRWLFLTGFVIVAVGIVLGTWNLSQKASKAWPAGVLPAEYAIADTVTADIKDPSKTLVRVSTADRSGSGKAGLPGRLIADYGSYVIHAVDKDAKLLKTKESIQRVDTTISLPGTSFDPVLDPQKGTVAPGSEVSSGGGYFIVQFGVTATDDLLDSLKTAGLEVLQYVPNQAFFVYGSDEAALRVAEHSRVRWVGRFLPEYKISPILKSQLEGANGKMNPDSGISPLEMSGPDTAIFDVAVFKRADLGMMAIEVSSAAIGKVVNAIDLPGNFFNVVRVEMPVDQIEKVSLIPGVVTIDPWFMPKAEDERSAHIVAGNYTNGTTISGPGYNPLTQFGFDGTGVTISVVDDGVSIPGTGGFYITATNTVDAPLRGSTAGADGGHGHLNASIISGDAPFGGLDPTGHNYGLGVAPKSHILNIPLLKAGYTGTEADTVSDTVTTPGPNGVNGFITNNSWGAGTNGNSYDAFAAQYDGFVRDATVAGGIDPILIVFSAGNSGASGLTRPKVAKNIIATGSTENLRPEIDAGIANNFEEMSTFSSRGPAADTRVKPDISAPGGGVSGGRAGTGGSVSGQIDANHSFSFGTSHAAPNLAGAAALFTQFWKSGHSGMNPSPALVKAALINGTVDMTGTGATGARPNGDEGWGRVNLKNVLNTGTSVSYIDQLVSLETVGQTRLYSGNVADNTKPVRISLVWTDPPGVTNPALVNDLDLTVTVGGNTYLGNVFSSGSSTTGGVADNRNNIENVFLPAGVSGPISIAVNATALNGDGVLGNADTTDQHYALVVYNSNVAVDPAAFLTAGTPVVTSGNGLIEPSENNNVNITLQNFGETTATAVNGTLSSTTPGVTFTNASSAYANITGPGGSQTNSTAFGVSTDASVAFLASINLKLTVTFTGGTSPVEFNFVVPVARPSLAFGTPTVTSGNNIIEPNECNTLNLPVLNNGDAPATAISAVLTTTTPGVIISGPNAGYANIAPGGGSQTNTTPFEISTGPSVACLTNIALKLTVHNTGGPTPVEFNFTMPVGQAGGNYVFTSTTGSIPGTPASATLVAGSQADDTLFNLTAPFAFSVYGTNVAGGSTLRGGPNGNIQFVSSGGSTAFTNAAIPATTFGASTPTLLPYWDDLIMSTTRFPTAGVYEQVLGSAPNRQWVIEWRAQHFSNVAADGMTTNFAVVISEGSSNISYVYALTGTGGTVVNANGASATVGVQAANSGSIFTQHSFNQAVITPTLQLNGAIPPPICSPGTGQCANAPVEVSGRVTTAGGRGLAGAVVTITDAAPFEGGIVQTVQTSSFGYFRFPSVPINGSYTVSVNKKRYTFTPQNINTNSGAVNGMTFTASP